jgi:molybdenum cofactor synthesis domain-containing protein
MQIAILTLSDRCAAGQMEDRSGPALAALAQELFPAAVISTEILPDDQARLASRLIELADAGKQLILTTGGTGLGPRDRTPEATRAAIDREAPGLAELMRAEGIKQNKFAALSRGIAGLRGQTLILNLPGSERGARESFLAVAPLLKHALDTIAGGDQHP